MCSSQGLCGSSSRPNRSSSDSGGSGAHYALCALGVGLIALGVIMIVWTVIPMDGEATNSPPTVQAGNTTAPADNDEDDDEDQADTTKSSTVAMVLVAVGAILLILSICVGVRNKRRVRSRGSQATAAALLAGSLPGPQEEA